MADSYIINKSGNSADFTISFDKTNNFLKNATIATEFSPKIDGEDITITIPTNHAAAEWRRCIYSLELDANYMYMLIAKDNYNGFGRLAISNHVNRLPYGNSNGYHEGNHAVGFFPGWKIIDDDNENSDFKSAGSDQDNYALLYNANYCYFYMQKDTIRTILTVPFEIWFCGDLTLNKARTGFTVNLALYKQKI